MEIPKLHPARQGIPRGVLFHRHRKQHAAGGYRYKDGASGQRYEIPDRVQRDQRGQGAEHLSRVGIDAPKGEGFTELHPV